MGVLGGWMSWVDGRRFKMMKIQKLFFFTTFLDSPTSHWRNLSLKKKVGLKALENALDCFFSTSRPKFQIWAQYFSRGDFDPKSTFFCQIFTSENCWPKSSKVIFSTHNRIFDSKKWIFDCEKKKLTEFFFQSKFLALGVFFDDSFGDDLVFWKTGFTWFYYLVGNKIH